MMKCKTSCVIISIIVFSVILIPKSQAITKWWDKLGEPKYGGMLTVRTASLGATSFDPAVIMGPQVYQWEYESLFTNSWATDRKEWSYKAGFVPVEYTQGLLAASWKQTGPTTFKVKLRRGVRWQNKPPVNGREFTAKDVEYSYDRLLGSGSGFSKPSFLAKMMIPNVKKVKANDKYTVTFYFKKPSALNLLQVVCTGPLMVAREWVEQGDLQNAKNAVGTGPWIVDKYVQGSSLIFKKNPDYYGYDERHPKNKLPYIDKMKVIEIPDSSTAMAALRTGRIDINTMMTIQHSMILAKTNPDIQRDFWPGPSATLELRCDHKPFNDIRVRKAMQMAINTKAIAKLLYSGLTDGIPCGLVSPILKGWAYNYDQWPKALRNEYRFNPEKSKKLLAAAGYPGGFSTNCIISSTDNKELIQIVKAYLKEINIDMDIKVMDAGSIEPYLNAGKHDQIAMMTKSGSPGDPTQSHFLRFSKGWQNYAHVNDKYFDKLYNRYSTVKSMKSIKKLSVSMDKYAIEQHWSVSLGPLVDPITWQPWIKGYSGELTFVGQIPAVYYARMWIDESLKK